MPTGPLLWNAKLLGMNENVVSDAQIFLKGKSVVSCLFAVMHDIIYSIQICMIARGGK